MNASTPIRSLAALALLGLCLSACSPSPPVTPVEQPQGSAIPLPAPLSEGHLSLEAALLARRSVRAYGSEPLTLEEISQLLWAAQGLTSPTGGRSAPSAGGLYPLRVYLLAGNVTGLDPGIYRFDPPEHALLLVRVGDQRPALHRAALKQSPVADGAAAIVITANYQRTTGKYDRRGVQYVHIEVGAAAQNVYLQAQSLGLGTVLIGAFHDGQVREVLLLNEAETPLAIMPVGRTTE